jgi:anti-sigma factor RsiW
MTEPNIPVTEDELHAFVDGELPRERRAAVEAWLASHPDDADKVASWRALADDLRARYGGLIDEPVPARLAVAYLAAPARWRVAAIAAAAVLTFVVGGAAGWFAHGAARAPSGDRVLASEALDAHRLYVVEVRHPVEVPAAERAHLVQWLSKRLGYDVRAPDLDALGLRLVGGRLLPGPGVPAAFLMYETQSGDRITLYSARTATANTQMRYAADAQDGALFWADNGVGYVVSGSGRREQLQKVAGLVYDQIER